MKKLFSLLFFVVPFLSFSQDKGLDTRIDEAFAPISDFFSEVVFFPVGGYPFVILLLVGSAAFFTLYFGFPNIKYFWTAINVVRGKHDDLDKDENGNKEGEVSHFQALATAVSGTVGNGNIAGVALAIALGGPGATFWMVVCGLLGMSTKFVECTLGVQYRDVGEDGTIYGGPMYYLSKGLKDKGWAKLGKVTAVLFAIFCIGGSFGGGNAAQSNQAAEVIENLLTNYAGIGSTTSSGAIIGLVMAVLVGLIIIGGIKRIASVTEKVVPFMAVLYIVACLYILLINFSFIDDAISLIISEAFSPKAIGVGGVIGVLMVGFRRAAFSNEAGAGSASIAHSAVKTKYSASEGLVALLEPFIDTVVICTMTALVIITFNSANNPQEEFKFGDITKVENAEYEVKMKDGKTSYYTYEEHKKLSDEFKEEIEETKINYVIDDYDKFIDLNYDGKLSDNIILIKNQDTYKETSLLSIMSDTVMSDTDSSEKIKRNFYIDSVKISRDDFEKFKFVGTTGKVLIDGEMVQGAVITQKAFSKFIPFADILLAIAVFLFAISTMISWSYYGLQSWKYLFGRGKAADMTYKVLFLIFVVIGAAASMDSIWAFSDAMIFAMVFPNMIGLYFLFPVVKEQLDKYLKAIKSK
jgi:AGCS family alanine or glycine:cation symporter